VEDMCYERRRAEACVDESAHHALANAGGREIVGEPGPAGSTSCMLPGSLSLGGRWRSSNRHVAAVRSFDSPGLSGR
jgi:hypothetical protein